MGRFSGKTCRLMTMIGLTTIFFLVEIIVGYATGSVALIADSFHMLSDIISLIVGLTAVKMSKKTTSKNTYGWQRAEVLGALVNSVFLIALCFTIVVEAVQRFIDLEEITNPELVLIVGGVGMFINVIGLVLFWTHGMSHGHSHGGGSGHSHGKSKPKTQTSNGESDFNYTKVTQGTDAVSQPNGFAYTEIEDSSDTQPNQNQNSKHLTVDISTSLHDEEHQEKEDHESIDASGQLNMRGVFLHVLGDALGSVVVIVSALFIMLTDFEWKYYVDPVMSLIIVVIIISTTIPLFKQSSMILLQSLPTDVDIDDIEDRLLRKVGGIENVHEFHIWQLSSDKIIATAHIRFSTIQDYVKAAQELKTFLHDEGIHSTTIQPEFSSDMMVAGSNGIDDTDCMLKCQPEADCRTMTCCDNQNTVKQRRKSADKGSRKSQPQTPPTRQSSPAKNNTAMGVTISTDSISGKDEEETV